jgi:hypothetical protein
VLVEERTDEIAATSPWWLRPRVGVALVVLLVLFNRWIGGVVVPLATLVLVGSVLVLGLAVLLPGFRARWFG